MRAPLTVAACAAALVFPATASAAAPPPPGANVPCTPTAAKPNPVVLVHGTFGNRFNSWQAMSPTLKAAGYCVYALNYGSYNGSGLLGVYGVGPIERSAQELAAFVDRVRQQTGAAKVDIVGHSQGGMMPRYYLKFLGGAAKVDDLVGLSPSNHGTLEPARRPERLPLPGVPAAGRRLGPPAALNSGDESPGDVSYTQVVTRYDEVVIPYTSGFLAPDARVTNVTLQDKCPNDFAEHLRDHLQRPRDPDHAARAGAQRAGRPGLPTVLRALRRSRQDQVAVAELVPEVAVLERGARSCARAAPGRRPPRAAGGARPRARASR